MANLGDICGLTLRCRGRSAYRRRAPELRRCMRAEGQALHFTYLNKLSNKFNTL
jgi:hypothetical protein